MRKVVSVLLSAAMALWCLWWLDMKQMGLHGVRHGASESRWALG